MLPHCTPPAFLGSRLHLGTCGSIAAYKLLDVLRAWTAAGIEVTASLTESAQQFVTPLSFQALGAKHVFTTMFGDAHAPDSFGHLYPLHHAQALVIAPATATMLARLAHGLADEILSCQALAFEGPCVIAPAMNPAMWAASATQANWETLRTRGFVCLEPNAGGTACGDTGRGRLCAPELIYLHGLKAISPQDFADTTALLTIGPTREYFDPARFWSNPSTGLMGASLAIAAWLRGATVHAICGPGVPWLPESIHRHDVGTANEMFAAAMDLFPIADFAFCTAAVADFAPVSHGTSKYKKEGQSGPLTVSFSANPDILSEMGNRKKTWQTLVGFAAETGELAALVPEKLNRKKADIIVGNQIGQPNSGFASASNAVYILDAHGRAEQWPSIPKPEVAWRILDWLCLEASPPA